MIASDQMRKYYWSTVLPHASTALIDAGWERERFSHIDLVHKFFKTTLNRPTTTDLSNEQFANYIEDIIRICAVYLHYTIPDAKKI